MEGFLYLDKKSSADKLHNYVGQVVQMVKIHRWIIDAYLSDYFVDEHWDRLNPKWTATLSGLSPPELAQLLKENSKTCAREVWPLSLLAFKAATRALSLYRQPQQLDSTVFSSLVGANEHHTYHTETAGGVSQCDVSESPEVGAKVNGNETKAPSSMGSSNQAEIKDGQYMSLEHCYRRHVKPKKQHEIQQLGQVIHDLCTASHCNHVVDVGAGQGHLSRLLSFGYGVKVTTIESAGGHAPKATKFDSEVKQDIESGKFLKRKRKSKPDMAEVPQGGSAPSGLSMPNHVVCTISTEISLEDFLSTIQMSSGKTERSQSLPACGVKGQGDSFQKMIQQVGRMQMQACAKTNQYNVQFESYKKWIEEGQRVSSMNKSGSTSNPHISGSDSHSSSSSSSKLKRHSLPDRFFAPESGPQEGATLRSLHEQQEHELPPVERSKDDSSHGTRDEGMLFVPETNTQRSVSEGAIYSEPAVGCGVSEGHGSEGEACEFCLVGLHACGDLTPTMLRVFCQCPTATALASVACCYMKLSCLGEDDMSTAEHGYPMSKYVQSLSDHHLSYEAREMACHFADAYYSRLKENSPNLLTHCYRAALQAIITDKNPNIKHGCIKLSVKRTHQLPFPKYAELALHKLGLDPHLTELQLSTAEDRLKCWEQVVAFYTLRLSLAPVVETLLLLDRMLYLHEQGLNCCVVPIFDPELSPRNFVLLAAK